MKGTRLLKPARYETKGDTVANTNICIHLELLLQDEAAVGTMVVKRGIFQALASMAFPMMTIHSVVKYSAKSIFKYSKSTWGPTAMGLAVIPFLPYIFDEPVEHLVDKAFEPIERYVGSQTKVPHVAHQTVLEEKKVQ